MLRHYYTLIKLVESFRAFQGFEVIECFSQEKDSLILTLYNGRKPTFISFSANPAISYIYATDQFSRARKNTVDLMPAVTGDHIQDVELLPGNRIIKFSMILSDLYFYLFGGSRGNLVATDKNGIIIDALSNKKALEGTMHNLPDFQPRSITEFEGEKPVLNVLANSSSLLGKHYAMELCIREKIDPSTKLSNFDADFLVGLETKAFNMMKECLDSKKFFILGNMRDEVLLSLIPLMSHRDVIADFEDINRTVRYRIFDAYSTAAKYDIKKKISISAMKLKSKLEREIALVEDSRISIERADNYKIWAEMLISCPDTRQKPGKEVILKYWDGTEMIIPLEPSLNLAENSEKYFSKARQARRALEERKKRLPMLTEKLGRIINIIENSEKSEEINDLRKLKTDFEKIAGMKMDSREVEIQDKFRKFEIAAEYIVYVGKSAANNDELTMKFAKPNDIWLHARGTGGSHCILRSIGGRKIPRDMIKRAAEIAAYYSQAKNAKYVPVAYTEKKYVRKPKGANPGSVVIAREEVIMVEPRLPQSDDED